MRPAPLFVFMLAAAACAPAVPRPQTGGGRDAGDAAREAPRPAGADAPAAPVTPPDRPAVPPADAAPPRSDGPAAEAAASDGPAVPVARAGEISIDEILIDPAGNDLGREWVEVRNVTDHAVGLGALHLSDGTTDVAV